MALSFAGMGQVAGGMADMEGQLAQNKYRHQLNEQMASQVRQQQEREAFERMARRNVQGMQWNPGELPQAQVMQRPGPQAGPAPAEPAPGRNENYGNEGRGAHAPVVTGDLERLQAERAQYEQLHRGAQSNLAALNEAKNIPPSAYFAEQERKRLGRVDTMKRGVNAFAGGPVFNVPPPGQDARADLAGQAAGYKQGVAQYDELINAQRAKDSAPVVSGGKRASKGEAALRPVIAGTPEEQAMNAGTESTLHSSNLVELQKELARTKDPEARAVLEQELASLRGGAQQQQAAAPQQPARQNLAGQPTMVSGPNYDLYERQLRQKFDYLNTVMANTFDSQQRLAVLGQMQQLQMQGQELGIKRLADSAQFNPQAMQQLVGLFAGRVGQELGVVQDGRGNAQLVGADGQPLPGQWGQPMPAHVLADAIGSKLTPSLSAAAAQAAGVRSEALAKSSGEAAGKAPYKERELMIQGQNMVGAQMAHGEYALQQKLLEAGLSQNEIKGATFSPTGDGVLIRTERGVFMYTPGSVDKNNPNIKTEGELSQIMSSGGGQGAFQGNYPRG